MDKKKLLERIAVTPGVLVGKPVIRGTRLSVQFVLGLLAQGMTTDEIVQEYEGLSREDIQACLLFATEAIEDATFVPLVTESS